MKERNFLLRILLCRFCLSFWAWGHFTRETPHTNNQQLRLFICIVLIFVFRCFFSSLFFRCSVFQSRQFSKRNTGQRNPLTHQTACILNNLKHIYMRTHHYHIFNFFSSHLAQIKVFLKPYDPRPMNKPDETENEIEREIHSFRGVCRCRFDWGR